MPLPIPPSMPRRPIPLRHGASTHWHPRRWGAHAPVQTSRSSRFPPTMCFRATSRASAARMIPSIRSTFMALRNWVANLRSGRPAPGTSFCAHPGFTAPADPISSPPCSKWLASGTQFGWLPISGATRHPRATWRRRSALSRRVWSMTATHPTACSTVPVGGRCAGLTSQRRYFGNRRHVAGLSPASNRSPAPNIRVRPAAPPIPRST